MRTSIFLILGLSILFSCKEVVEEGTQELYENDTVSQLDIGVDTSRYPASLLEVLDAHGGLLAWRQKNNICFEMEGKAGTEIHTISLPNRNTKIVSNSWSIGNNGDTVWLQEREPNAYSGNARFYHNLMFYFYAMPFVLADPGIVYQSLPTSQLAGKSYEGIEISYEEGVGDSPDDEYRIYYDPETHQMAWLGYTVTYNDQQESDDWHYIHYTKWQRVNGLLLPETLAWYTVENGVPKEKRNKITFTKVVATETILENSVFEMPPGAIPVGR
jgi:hypothetical protein